MAINISNDFFVNRLVNQLGEEIEIDGFSTVTETRSNVITEGTLINGQKINDAIHRLPTSITCTVIITDNPKAYLDKIQELPTTIINSTGLQIVDSRSLTEYNKLVNWFDNKTPLSIYTKAAVYRDYAIQTMTVPQTSEKAFRIQLTLKEIIGVSRNNNSEVTLLRRLGLI